MLYFSMMQYSVVKSHDRRPESEKKRHLFFIFFEWKNDIIEQSYLIYTTTPWSIGAGLCGVFLTLHRGYQLAQTSYKRVQKDNERRRYHKRTVRELRKQKSMQSDQSQAHMSKWFDIFIWNKTYSIIMCGPKLWKANKE